MSQRTSSSRNPETHAVEDTGTLLVVDGHSLAFRAFFALPVDNFSTSSGMATNAIWGFASMLSQVIQTEKPDHLAVAFDVKGGTFRNTLLPQYKGTRDAAPEELLPQLPLIQRMLMALGVVYIEKPGYEGDDIIGTLASMGEKAGLRTLVLSGDRDAFQLIDDDITVLYPGHHFKDLHHMTAAAVIEKYHVTPTQYPDLAALRGETADNIPGVPGVGDGYAAKWIAKYGSLQGIVENAESIGGKKGESLRENIDQVLLNRKVNALVRDLDLGVDIDAMTFGHPDRKALTELFHELEFGERTMRRVLDAFDVGGDDSDSGVEPAAELDMPRIEIVSTADQLRAWAAQCHAGDVGATDAAASVAGAGAASDPGPSDRDIPMPGEDGLPAIDQRVGAPAIESAITVHAEGCPKPGGESLETLVLMDGGRAAVIEAADIEVADIEVDDTEPSAAARPGTAAAQSGTARSGTLRDALSDALSSWEDRVIVHGYKEHLHMLGAWGIHMPRPVFDTKLGAYLDQPDFHADTVEQCAAHFLDVHVDDPDEEPAQGTLDIDGTTDDEPDDRTAGRNAVREKAVRHAAIVHALAVKLGAVLDERHQYGLLTTIELPVSQSLYGMEVAGARVDAERIDDLLKQFTADAEQAQSIAWEAAGREVNLQSPKQLQSVLFDELGLRPTRRTKTGARTTSAAALQDLYVHSAGNERANTFLGALLRHRETNKLKQIVQTLIDSINPRDGRIHTTYEQTVAATGRLSSTDPNLQNIPNRNTEGREIRSVFVPGEGYESLLSCDYSQVELRIMADLSGDEALIEAFRSGADFHRYVASLVYQIPVEDISSDQRGHVKAMSYGLAYGLSTYGLARQLGVSPAAADVLKEKYFATFGKVHDYLESLVAGARDKGYTETMFGRRRYFPALRSTNRAAREAAERGALNAPIQGSAADIMKLAMIRATRSLRAAGLRSRVILQIHDELVVEVAAGELDRVEQVVRDAMENAVSLAVPLSVSVGVGADWQLAAH